MLAVRNYLNGYEDEADWPLCWESRRGIRLGLTVCLETLKTWQAFRPQSVDQFRRPLGQIVPRIVRNIQHRFAKRHVYRAMDLARTKTSIKAEIVKEMSRAVARVSTMKKGKRKSTPMLGSKVLHFYFPEFFPVWDTAWIKKELKKFDTNVIRMPPGLAKTLSKKPSDQVALEYARYVWLMLREAKLLSHARYERLKTVCIRAVQRRNGHRLLRQILDDNIHDLTPILFELCVIGARDRRSGHAQT
jgi:hypothetical protein